MSELTEPEAEAEIIECKHEGCLEPAADLRGRYAHLCVFHKNQKRHQAQNALPPPDGWTAAKGNGGRVDATERFLAAARALADAEHGYDTALEALRRTQ